MLLIILIIALKTGPLKKDNNKTDITRQGKKIRKLSIDSFHYVDRFILITSSYIFYFIISTLILTIDYTEDNSNSSRNEISGNNEVVIRGLEDRLRELDRQ